ncbi:hypothetical protein GGI19_002780 [Coemansia pectinata]|uniref:Nuclear transport factor 2 n=1 Tax=Coemansia pectinata TaxID=1052879 RepID=A0A9W8GZG8_9FUNG|nr:hypothetical protein GGI19_002780 [Coemansia pectinata]
MFQQDAKQGASQSLSLGERFVDQYYSGFNKCGKYYQPTSKVMWNGNGYSGEQFKATVLPDLQRQLSGFEVTGFDCHALGDGPTLITVSGFVTIDRKERFSQTFIIERIGGLTYIQSDCFRIV